MFNPTPPRTENVGEKGEKGRGPVPGRLAAVRTSLQVMAARDAAGQIPAGWLGRGTEMLNSMPWREIRYLPTGEVLPRRAALFAVPTLTPTLSAIVAYGYKQDERREPPASLNRATNQVTGGSKSPGAATIFIENQSVAGRFDSSRGDGTPTE